MGFCGLGESIGYQQLNMANDHVDQRAVKDFLYELLQRQITPSGREWLDQKLKQVGGDFTERDFYLAFGMVPRRIGKGPLEVPSAEREKAEALLGGFAPQFWTIEQTGRTILLLQIAQQGVGRFFEVVDKLFSTAEVGELVALYGSLALWPQPETQHGRATEGVRTNMTVVFDAIALNNPYPYSYLSEEAWNQLVLKAVFMGRPLYRIYGLDARANSRLAQMLSDFAHERWAAGRWVIPELWRPIGPFLNETYLQDVAKLFDDPDPMQQEAGALACSQANLPRARELLDSKPEIKSRIESGALSWEDLGERLWASRKG